MSEVLIENGDYEAEFTGAASLYENHNKVLVFCPILKIGDYERKAFVPLTRKDTFDINERNVNMLKKVFPKWDGETPDWLEQAENIEGAKCIATVLNETDDKGRTWSNVKNIRELGSESVSDTKLPESMDRKALQAKYGAKFRALSASKGKPLTKKIEKKAAEDTKADCELPQF